MDTTILYIFSLIIISLVLLLVGVITLYLRQVSKTEEIKRGKQKPVVDPETLLAQARERSQAILTDAHTKAIKIVGNAEDFIRRDEGAIAKEFAKSQEAYIKVYKDMLESSGKKADQVIQNIPQDIKLTLISAVDNFRVSLSREIGKAQEEANKSIREAYQHAADDVNKYKEERIKQVDSTILEMVKEVTEKVLSKTITTDEHEKLVQKSLEEAKRQKIF